ncbi:NUDIX domain-containing protein [Photobacterium aphoticum]|nr:NUDIX domain-containing protein [Photobacterium aphoticum]
MDSLSALSLYVHVPFCQVRCKFCEYTVLDCCDETEQTEYVDLLLQEMAMYSQLVKDKLIMGFDLGGGTPSILSVENLTRLTQAVTDLFALPEEVVWSVETTPAIAAKQPEKIATLYDLGYRRISMGIQTVSERLLNEIGREGSRHLYLQARDHIRAAGFEQFNIDLMYGFLKQDSDSFKRTLRYAIELAPDFITLYRNRYKGTKIENEAGGVSIHKAMNQYNIAYEMLTAAGYHANPGKNTFSKIANNYGTSDYLTKRVVEGTPYIGLGLGAQSFGRHYLAYNAGAATKNMKQYRRAIEAGQFPIQDLYALPREESMAKFVSVAFYFGFIDLKCFRQRFGLDFLTYFQAEVQFLLEREYMTLVGERLMLTQYGANYINGIIPLFYSQHSKDEMCSLSQKMANKLNDTQTFLSTYQFEKYPKTSVTADIVLLRGEKPSLLLIKRGAHPFMNSWALPGGFIKPTETLEHGAERELHEETGIEGIHLTAGRVFSEPNRDPRGWIISHSFHAHIPLSASQTRCGDDAIDCCWFELSLQQEQSAAGSVTYRVKLKNENSVADKQMIQFCAVVSLSGSQQQSITVTENEGLAFDHAEIIVSALVERGLLICLE